MKKKTMKEFFKKTEPSIRVTLFSKIFQNVIFIVDMTTHKETENFRTHA